MTVDAGRKPAGAANGTDEPSGLDAFISYSHHDIEFAVRLRDALRAAGQNAWLDESDIHGGTRWSE